MNRYPQNYLQEYYGNTPQTYEGYLASELCDFQGNCGDEASSLQIPNAQLYTEDVQPMTEGNSQFCDYPLSMEIPTRSCRQLVSTTFPLEYYNDAIQTHQFRPITLKDPVTSKHINSCSHNIRYGNQYPVYQNEEILCVHPNTNMGANISNMEERRDDNNNFEIYQDSIQYKSGHYNAKTNAINYRHNLSSGNKFANDLYVERSDKKLDNYGQKISRKAVVKKYPVTVKMPKYVSKNLANTTINKKPSTLCLSVVTQPDPAIVRLKSKTNHNTKKNLGSSELYSGNIYDQDDNYSAHKMHSQGDVKNNVSRKGLETALDKYENDMAFNKPVDLYRIGEANIEQKNGHIFKEFAKYLKPKIPSSIKIKQEKITNMRTSSPLRPKLKLSLDKLLNRLEKCENGDKIEKSTEGSCRFKLKNMDKINLESKDIDNVNKVKSFNYETLSRKCSQSETKDRGSDFNSCLKQPLDSVLGSFDSKRSERMMKPMDDQCALDLHRSKSYIVDLIDRALSKELGTMPRGQLVHQDLTPHKAITTISKHQQSSHKELCYEVTAALTDSIISSATAPPKQDFNQIIERSTSDQQIKEKTDDNNYITQLKQLRWGHIRHIQHEARKLADLEEFLEKCGEIE